MSQKRPRSSSTPFTTHSDVNAWNVSSEERGSKQNILV